jgi:hypothetical protein
MVEHGKPAKRKPTNRGKKSVTGIWFSTSFNSRPLAAGHGTIIWYHARGA